MESEPSAAASVLVTAERGEGAFSLEQVEENPNELLKYPFEVFAVPFLVTFSTTGRPLLFFCDVSAGVEEAGTGGLVAAGSCFEVEVLKSEERGMRGHDGMYEDEEADEEADDDEEEEAAGADAWGAFECDVICDDDDNNDFLGATPDTPLVGWSSLPATSMLSTESLLLDAKFDEEDFSSLGLSTPLSLPVLVAAFGRWRRFWRRWFERFWRFRTGLKVSILNKEGSDSTARSSSSSSLLLLP